MISLQRPVDILHISVKIFGGTHLCMKYQELKFRFYLVFFEFFFHLTHRKTSNLSFKTSIEHLEYDLKLMQWSRGFWDNLSTKTAQPTKKSTNKHLCGRHVTHRNRQATRRVAGRTGHLTRTKMADKISADEQRVLRVNQVGKMNSKCF